MESSETDVFGVLGRPAEFVGREEELRALDSVLDRAISYQAPQLVTILGNQGTGKSRLLAEWIARVEKSGRGVRVFRGRADERGSEYGVFQRLLRERFALSEAEDKKRQVERVRSEIERVFGDRRVAEVAHFLGAFLELSVRESPFLRAVAENPAQRDQIARTVLRRFLEVDAEKGPLVLAFEDFQWGDERSLSLLRELGEGLGGSPVVLIALARPDLFVRYPQWGSFEGDHTRIDLRALDPSDAEKMLRRLLARAGNLPADFVEQAVEQTGGNPFFLEELVRLYMANGAITHSGRIDLRIAEGTQLPLTVEEAVQARIAALAPPERDVLEKASTLGNVFWTGTILALTRLRHEVDEHRGLFQGDGIRERIEKIIDEMVDRDYILRIPDSSIPGEHEYCFKHNLERELIAKMTEPERARKYHLFAAQWLEVRMVDRSEEHLEFLGQLYDRGGNPRRAAYLFIAAGDKARARYANDAAIAFYERGIELLEFDDALAKIEALHNLGDVCALVGKTERALATFEEMLRYAWLLDLKPKGGAAHGRIGRLFRQRGDFDKSLEHLSIAHKLFVEAADRRGIAASLDDIGKVHWLRGEYDEALSHCRQALGLRREIGDLRSIALSLSNIGRVHHDSGGFKAALECFDEALDIRREIEDKPGEIRSLWDLGRVNEALGDVARAYVLYEQAYGKACEIGDRLGQAHLLANMGDAMTKKGDAREAAKHLGEAAELAQSLGDRLLLSECARSLGETYLLLGDSQAAREQCRLALELAEKVRSRPHAGAALRALARVTSQSGAEEARDDGQVLYERAVAELVEVGNELELARCYREYADFEDRLGRAHEARSLRARAEEISARLRGAAQNAASMIPIELDVDDVEFEGSSFT